MSRHLQDMRLHSEIASCTAAYLAAKLHNFSGTASTTAIFQKLLHAPSLHGQKHTTAKSQPAPWHLCCFCIWNSVGSFNLHRLLLQNHLITLLCNCSRNCKLPA